MPPQIKAHSASASHRHQQHEEHHAAYGDGYAYYAPPQYNYDYGYNYDGHSCAYPHYKYQPPSEPVTDRGAPVMPPPKIVDSAVAISTTDANAATAFPSVESISVHDNDVLFGRGGKNNQHTGNERLRDMARAVRDRYKASAKKGKSNMSRELVQQVRDLNPPGRFLKRNPVTNEWEDVGDDIAREKVSQVLRDAVSEWVGPKAAAAGSTKQQNGEEKQDGKSKENGNAGKKRAKPSVALPPLPPPPPEIASSKEDSAPVAVPVVTEPEMPPLSSNAATTNEKVAKGTDEALKAPGTIKAAPEIPSLQLQDDLDDLPPASGANLLVPDASLPSLPITIGLDAGRDRFLSDMSVNDTALGGGGELIDEHKLETLNPDGDDAQPMRLRLDTDDSFDESPSTKEAAAKNTNKRRPSLKVPVSTVPWNRNKRKTHLLDRYANMNMGLSSSDMSISTVGSQQLSSRNLGAQLSSRQLMSTGARQMSSRQLSSRQLSSRQLSSRQLSSRQLSGRQLMSMDQRKQNFAMMGESDLSLDTLSISGDTNRSLSRKNIFMNQYMNMDMGLSDFSLGSMAAEPLPMHAGESVLGANGRLQRPSIIIEGDLEELSESGSSHHLRRLSKHGSTHGNGAGGRAQAFSDTYNAVGMGTSISNMTVNTIGTFSGHSRRGFFANTGNSMRIESGHSFMSMQLEMLDDELFDEFGADDVEERDEFGTMEDDYDDLDNEFATEFC